MGVEVRQPRRDDTGGRFSLGIETAASDLLDSTAGNDLHALRAVLRVSQAVSGAQHLDDALEVIAEQSLIALDAASFSISRWERHRGVLRTLINVGELGPREERWPRDERTSTPSTTTTRTHQQLCRDSAD
jgi:hypothetical protein